MKELEKSLKALANRRRLAILKHLKRNKEASVGEIAAEIRLSFKSTSRHLAVLASADIVEKDQRSLQVFYRLASSVPASVRSILTIL
ncbi:MAG: winged helix-turn-helix transcriptional regulator [Candidatus Liptonbacteria bacterium]|nr:winged helix-turn-helix transcriptional regulator [Candidatus Liptonbacteria bacterium]